MPESLICGWDGVVVSVDQVDPAETFTFVPDPMDRIRDIYWNGYPVDPDNPTIVGGE